MSTRTILSRPRTRVYDCNYNIGQSYYKPMVDHLDRKYSGRPTELPAAYPANRAPNPEEQDLFRTRRAATLDFPEEAELANGVGRGGKALGAALREFDDIFDNRPTARGGGTRGASLSNGTATNGFDSAADDLLDDVSASMKRLRATRAARLAEELEEETDAVTSRRRNQMALKQERDTTLADRALESVGLRKINAGDLLSEDADSFIKKRTLRITTSTDAVEQRGNPELTKWTKVGVGSPLALESASEAAAISRARQTRNRLQDLESEMEELAERSANRERRAAQLRSLVAESSDRAAEEDSSSVRVKTSLRSEKKTVTF